MFDPAFGSGTYNLLYICRSVACSDLLIELFQGVMRRPRWSPTEPSSRDCRYISVLYAQDARVILAYPRLHARRVGRQAKEERDFVFDAHNNQG